MLRVLLFWLGWALAGLSAVAGAAEGPAVVVTIKPIHSLVAGVMAGQGAPTLLVKGARSPHDYALKPSEAHALERAEIVFWIGEGLETFLARPIHALAAEAEIVALAEAPGVKLLPAREGGAWNIGAHAHEADGHDHDEGPADHGDRNLHAWLDPQNAAAMVDAIADALARHDPTGAARFRTNAAALKARLAALDTELKANLGPLAGRPYIVLHDAYPNLEKRYGLSPAGSITVAPGRPPSARRLSEIRRKIDETGALCVFAEPQFSPGLAEAVVAGTGARTGMLDPLGAAIAEGPDLYFELMRKNAAALRACLLDRG